MDEYDGSAWFGHEHRPIYLRKPGPLSDKSPLFRGLSLVVQRPVACPQPVMRSAAARSVVPARIVAGVVARPGDVEQYPARFGAARWVRFRDSALATPVSISTKAIGLV